jgi:glycosyltransferase involved in cell wall biosynthesis
MSDRLRTVLMIAYYFPPMGLSGVQRTLKFAKFLPKYGWKPTVLTVVPTGYYAMDRSLLDEAEEADIEIVRTSSVDLNRLFAKTRITRMPSEPVRKILQLLSDFFFIPDTKIGWKRRAVKVGSGLLRQKAFDAIFATAPPQTDLLIGLELKRRSKLPLVVEYRDSWLMYPFKSFPTPLHRLLHGRLERRVIRGCDKVIVTHRRVKEELLRRYPFHGHHDVVILPQGFDQSDFDLAVSHRKRSGASLRIVHAGTFYAGRNPEVILAALSNIFRESPHLRGRIQLRFIGTVRASDEQIVRKLGLSNDVVFTGYLEHRECVRELKDADLLWFIIDNDAQSPGKLYEYFGARKPILASISGGYTRQLLLDSKAAVVLPLADVAAHEQALREMLSLFERRKLPTVSEEFAGQFERVALTGELARLLELYMDIEQGAVARKGVTGS